MPRLSWRALELARAAAPAATARRAAVEASTAGRVAAVGSVSCAPLPAGTMRWRITPRRVEARRSTGGTRRRASRCRRAGRAAMPSVSRPYGSVGRNCSADRVVARLQVHVVVERGRGEVAEAGDQRRVAGERRGLRDAQRVGARDADLRARDDRQAPVVVGLQLVDRRREAGRREGAPAGGARPAGRWGRGRRSRGSARLPRAGDDLQRRQAALAQPAGRDDRARRRQRRRREDEAAVERVAPGLDRIAQRCCGRGRRGRGRDPGGDGDGCEKAHVLGTVAGRRSSGGEHPVKGRFGR